MPIDVTLPSARVHVSEFIAGVANSFVSPERDYTEARAGHFMQIALEQWNRDNPSNDDVRKGLQKERANYEAIANAINLTGPQVLQTVSAVLRFDPLKQQTVIKGLQMQVATSSADAAAQAAAAQAAAAQSACAQAAREQAERINELRSAAAGAAAALAAAARAADVAATAQNASALAAGKRAAVIETLRSAIADQDSAMDELHTKLLRTLGHAANTSDTAITSAIPRSPHNSATSATSAPIRPVGWRRVTRTAPVAGFSSAHSTRAATAGAAALSTRKRQNAEPAWQGRVTRSAVAGFSSAHSTRAATAGAAVLSTRKQQNAEPALQGRVTHNAAAWLTSDQNMSATNRSRSLRLRLV